MNFYKDKDKAFSFCPSEEISEGLWYCKEKDLYWKDGKVYDQLSASHNGLIGTGVALREMAKYRRSACI
jgi:hypothetical protein